MKTIECDYSLLAESLFRDGFRVVPIAPGYKYPKGIKNWQTIDYLIQPWPKGSGIGILTGVGPPKRNVIGIDIDVYDPVMVADLLKVFDGLPVSIRAGQWPKVLVPVLSSHIKEKKLSNKWKDSEGRISQIEVLSRGQAFVAYHIHPDTKYPYTWTYDLLKQQIPLVSFITIELLFKKFDELAELAGWELQGQQTKRKERPVKIYSGSKIWDKFNRSVSVEKVLELNGWTRCGRGWKRPGKKGVGQSGQVFEDKFVNFSSSVHQLEINKNYDAFGLVVELEYSGDFNAAVRAIRRGDGK